MQLILLYICVLVCIMYQGMPKAQKLEFDQHLELWKTAKNAFFTWIFVLFLV